MSAATRRKPVGLGYMPKGGAPAALRSNAEHAATAACAGSRAWPGRLVAVACCSVVVASLGALASEAALLWLIVNG